MASSNSSDAFLPNVTSVTDSGFHDTSSRNFDITSTMSSHEWTHDYDDEFIYGSYPFERTVYLYIWGILVTFTCLVNVIVISILVRKKMRNATNVVLAAIAISDSLTGLVTLPSYIMVYQNLDEGPVHSEYPHYDTTPSGGDLNNSYGNGDLYDSYGNGDLYDSSSYDNSMEGMDIYLLSKGLCQGFMMSKLFLSKSFHTISIYLTLCLGIQRFVSVAAPFSAKALTPMKALIASIVIAVLSPLLHVYQFVDEKAEYGMCQWTLDEGCKEGCVYLWVMFFLRQFIPCTVLLVFTILFIRELTLTTDSTKGQTAKRVSENRRIAVIVTAIVIVFLVAEIPYGFFALYNAIDKVAHDGKNMDIKLNRTVHVVYEMLQVLSFHANFYIYTLFNRKFRKCLKMMFVQPYRKLMGDTRRVSGLSTSQSRSTMRQTEMVSMNKMSQSESNSGTDKSVADSTRVINTVSGDITQ